MRIQPEEPNSPYFLRVWLYVFCPHFVRLKLVLTHSGDLAFGNTKLHLPPAGWRRVLSTD